MFKKNSSQLIILLSLLLTSCLNYTQVTTIKTDNSGEMFVHYWMKWKTQSDSIIYQKQSLFNRDSIGADFKCPVNKITNIEVYNDNTDSTIHGKVNFTFTNFDSLNFANAFRDADFSISDGEDNTKIFSQSLPGFVSGFNSRDSSLEIEYTYYLPGKIISHNAQSLSRNKLTWNITKKNISKLKILKAVYIPFRLKETPHIIYYLMILILLIVMYYLLRKKK